MKNRWIALYVENEVGVLAKVSGLFSGKSYNLQSLTVGTTEDETISRMTIGPPAGLRPQVRNPVLQGWYPNIGSVTTGVITSQPPTYPVHAIPNPSIKLE